jgi:hypothetical protein
MAVWFAAGVNVQKIYAAISTAHQNQEVMLYEISAGNSNVLACASQPLRSIVSAVSLGNDNATRCESVDYRGTSFANLELQIDVTCSVCA